MSPDPTPIPAEPGPRTFFEEGLSFSCIDCGWCCSGSPGVVLVSAPEITQIAGHLGLDEAAFREKHVREVPEGQSLKERENGDCEFFLRGRCAIHPVKPAQCRLYPFWFVNLRSPEAWNRTARDCPGIGQGRRYTREEILAFIGEDLDRREKIGLVRRRENRTIQES